LRHLILGVLMILGTPAFAVADESLLILKGDLRGPHGGQVFSAPGVEIELTSDAGGSHLFFLKPPKRVIPASVTLTLRTEKSRSFDIEMKATDPWRGLPHFQGVPLPLIQQPHTSQFPQKGIEFQLRY
jgi:hypothetical protein